MKRTVVIGMITMAVGVLLAVVALGHSGLKTVYWEHNGFKVARTSHSSKTYQREYTNNLRQIDFSTGDKVEVRTGEVAKPTVTYPAGTKVKRTGNQLAIHSKINHHTWRIGFDVDSDEEDDYGTTVVTLPKKNRVSQISGRFDDEVSLNNLTLKRFQMRGSADVNMQSVRLKSTLDINSDGGDVALSRVVAPAISQSSEGGDIELHHCRFSDGTSDLSSDGGDISLNSSHFSTVSLITQGGDISFSNNQINTHLSAETAGGDIDGRILEPDKAKVTATADGGDHELFGRDTHAWNLDKEVRVSYSLSTDGGDITID